MAPSPTPTPFALSLSKGCTSLLATHRKIKNRTSTSSARTA